jgi:hypothetical protein
MKTHRLLISLGALIAGMSLTGQTMAGVIGKVAIEQAISALSSELVAMTKWNKYAGAASGRANAQPDTDSDTIGWLLYYSIGPEFQINLDIDVADQQAKAFANIDYQVPVKGTWDSWLFGETKGRFINREFDASANPPKKGETDPQYAFVAWGIAMDGQVVFGPYKDEAGKDPFAEPTENLQKTSLRRASEMPDTAGTMTLATNLRVIGKTANDAIIAPLTFGDEQFDVTFSAGFIEDVAADVEPTSATPVDLAALDIPSGYDVLYDVGFSSLAEQVTVPLLDPLGNERSDEELFQIAAEQLVGFGLGRSDGNYTLDYGLSDIANSIANLIVTADFTIPFMLPSWESDRTFYSPNWSYWSPLIADGTATAEQAWSDSLAELSALGVDVRYANFQGAIGEGRDSAIATPSPGPLVLITLGVSLLVAMQRLSTGTEKNGDSAAWQGRVF